jgi:hypothetical protein
VGSSPRSWRESIKHLWLRGKCRADPKWVGRRCNSVDAISPESFAKALRCGDQTRRNTAPCAASIKFRGQVRRQTRRNLQADSRESRVRRVMDGVECHRESWGHLRRLWAPRMRSKRRRGGLDSSIRGKEAGVKVHQVGSQLESLHSVRNGHDFPQCLGQGFKLGRRVLLSLHTGCSILILSAAAVTSI